jgi:DNA-binding transcriptional ArsR family regulator
MSAKMDWALWVADLGLKVHPLHHPTKVDPEPANAHCSCGNVTCGTRTGKHPRMKDWQSQATTNEAQIRKWWKAWPEANVGVFTGTGDLLVLDKDGDAGANSLAQLEEVHGAVPKTFSVTTGRGRHHYFRKPPGHPKIANTVNIAPGLDVRADGGNGGNAVGPGSQHWSGEQYLPSESTDIAPAPAWLLELVTAGAIKGAKPPRGPHASARVGRDDEPDWLRRIPHEQRLRRARAYVAKAEPAVSGEGGHDVAMRVATAVVRGFALDPTPAVEVLQEWSATCIPPWSDDELHHKVDEATRVGNMDWGAKLKIGTMPSPFEFRSPAQMGVVRPPPTYLIPRFRIGPGRPTILSGFNDSGKTILAIDLAIAVVTGERLWGDLEIGIGGGSVVHFDYEMGEDEIDARYRRLAHGRRHKTIAKWPTDWVSTVSFPSTHLSTPGPETEAKFTQACQGKALAILDSLRAACPHANESDSTIRAPLDMLTRVSLATGCTVLVIAHDGKPGDGRRTGLQRLRGSSAISDAASIVLSVTKKNGVHRISQSKSSRGPAGDDVLVRIVDVGAVVNDAGDTEGLAVEKVEGKPNAADAAADGSIVERARGSIIEVLSNASTPLGVRELRAAVKGRRQAVTAALAELREEGIVVHTEGPSGKHLLRLASGGGKTPKFGEFPCS